MGSAVRSLQHRSDGVAPGRHAGVGRVRGGRPVASDLDRCLTTDAADAPESPTGIVVAERSGNTLRIDDEPGGITLSTAGGASIAITDSGIVVDNGRGARITLIGPRVSVNEGALEVT